MVFWKTWLLAICNFTVSFFNVVFDKCDSNFFYHIYWTVFMLWTLFKIGVKNHC